MRGPFMLMLGAGVLLLPILLAPQPGLAAEGVFQGKVIEPPADAPAPTGWIFVQGRNHLLRRVEVAHAVITFGQQIPPGQRRKCGPECLEVGQEIRVTADQDSAGEWRARRVEILRLTSHRASAQTASLVEPVRPGRAGAKLLGMWPMADLIKLNSTKVDAAG